MADIPHPYTAGSGALPMEGSTAVWLSINIANDVDDNSSTGHLDPVGKSGSAGEKGFFRSRNCRSRTIRGGFFPTNPPTKTGVHPRVVSVNRRVHWPLPLTLSRDFFGFFICLREIEIVEKVYPVTFQWGLVHDGNYTVLQPLCFLLFTSESLEEGAAEKLGFCFADNRLGFNFEVN